MQEGNSRTISRRQSFRVGAGVVVTAGTLLGIDLGSMSESDAQERLGHHKPVEITSHNADTLVQIRKSKGVHSIELDISQLKDRALVGAHATKDFLSLHATDQEQQYPPILLHEIRQIGAIPMVDVKNIEHAESFAEYLMQESQNGFLKVCTPHHWFLERLDNMGFNGQMLFTLIDQKDVSSFKRSIMGKKSKKGSFGVSVNDEVYTKNDARLFEEAKLHRLVWTPSTPIRVLEVLLKGTDGITTDNIPLLMSVGEKLKAA